MSFIEDLDKQFRVPGEKVAYLHNVSVDSGKAKQSNKFYYLYSQGNGTVRVVRGRIDHTFVEEKPTTISQWESVIKKKTQRPKDPYTDVTHLFLEEITATKQAGKQVDLGVIADTVVKRLFDELQAYANKSIQQNYTISSEKVTQKMVDEAQALVDKISNELKVGVNVETLNKELMKLYTIIPRKMGNVKAYLFNPIKNATDLETAEKLIGNEQQTLDVMAGQVAMNKGKADNSEDSKETKKTLNILEQLGLDIEHVTDKSILDMIKVKMEENAKRVGKVYKVVNKVTQAKFDKHLAQAKDKRTTLLFHGSRNQNWFSIIEKGLLIRPANAGYSGSMFDDGIYGALQSAKSLNYTGSAYATNSYVGGSEPKVFLALFEFHTGNQLDIYKHDSRCYTISQKVKAEGYDCVWAHKGQSLYRDEIIVYNSDKVTIKYLIEVL